MTHKELIEQIKKDCLEYIKKHNDDIDLVNNEFNKGTLTGAAVAYENIVHLIETYEKYIEPVDEDKLAELEVKSTNERREWYLNHLKEIDISASISDLRFSFSDIDEAYISGYDTGYRELTQP